MSKMKSKNVTESLTVNQQLYAVVGYSDICQNGNLQAGLYGVFSTEKLAKEAGDELQQTSVVDYYEIEYPRLDEFGYK